VGLSVYVDYLFCTLSSVVVFKRDAPDIRPDNLDFFISGIRPDTRLPAGYPVRPDT
jgi:hypothetical protein